MYRCTIQPLHPPRRRRGSSTTSRTSCSKRLGGRMRGLCEQFARALKKLKDICCYFFENQSFNLIGRVAISTKTCALPPPHPPLPVCVSYLVYM